MSKLMTILAITVVALSFALAGCGGPDCEKAYGNMVKLMKAEVDKIEGPEAAMSKKMLEGMETPEAKKEALAECETQLKDDPDSIKCAMNAKNMEDFAKCEKKK